MSFRSPAKLRAAFFDVAMIILGGAMTAGLVHVIAILIIPLYASNDAYARLSHLGATNATILLPAADAAALSRSVRAAGLRSLGNFQAAL